MAIGMDDLVLCTGCVRAAPMDVSIRAAGAAGARGVSVYYDRYVAARAAGWTDEALRALLAEHGLSVAEMDGPSRWLPGDTRGPDAADLVAVGAALGARSLTLLDAGRHDVGGSLSYADAAAAFAAVCDLAAPHGMLVHLEYFPASGIGDLTTAYELVRRAGRPNGGVLLDTWHHLRGPDAGRLDLGAAAAAVVGVQVSDVAPTPMADSLTEMLHHRRVPGEGVGVLPPLLRALRDGGCVAPFEVEVYSDVLAALPPDEAARRCVDGLRAVVSAAEAPVP
jgi:sugar phosphate isomerase/epimerase